MKNIKKIIAALLVSGFTCTTIFAATDGSLGSTSAGELEISVTIDSLVRISGLQDITLTVPDNPSTNIAGKAEFCVYSNTATAGYTITASGNGDSSAFQLTTGDGGASKRVNYLVYFKPETTNDNILESENQLTATTQKAGNTGSISTNVLNCVDGHKNATVEVWIAHTDIYALKKGAYTGTLNLTVAPE